MYPKLKEVDDVLGGAAAWENVDHTDGKYGADVVRVFVCSDEDCDCVILCVKMGGSIKAFVCMCPINAIYLIKPLQYKYLYRLQGGIVICYM